MTFNLSNIIKGIVAGFVATVVLSLLMMIKQTMGLMPALDPINMMSEMTAQKLNLPSSKVVGWILHFGLGSVIWGGLFVIFNSVLPGKGQVNKGMTFGVLAWLLMMILPMPMSGAGFFGLKIGIMAPVLTLILHLIFGAVMGFVYQKLAKAPVAPPPTPDA